MPIAFVNFDEPHAWLIRGLVEYGWPDTSRAGGCIPPGRPGGLNLGYLPESEGRKGIVLEVPAVAGEYRAVDDGSYSFQAQVTRSTEGVLVISVRCPEANYYQEFPYDSGNPSWAAGYIHQALSEYVPNFVKWRVEGNEVAWAQRAGIPNIIGEPCSYQLASFIRDRVNTNQPVDMGPQQGWWMATATPGDPATDQRWAGNVVGSGRGGGDPMYMSADARAAEVAAAVGGAADFGNIQARTMVKPPAIALTTVISLAIFQGLLAFLNALATVIWYRQNVEAIVFSVLFGMYLIAGGGIALLGLQRYKNVQKGILPWLSMLYAATTPVCCVGGFPVGVWAMLTWSKPIVKAARR